MDPLRRNRLEAMIPAERAIYEAMQEVEKLPASIHLTEAVSLLVKAHDSVADYEDERLKTLEKTTVSGTVNEIIRLCDEATEQYNLKGLSSGSTYFGRIKELVKSLPIP